MMIPVAIDFETHYSREYSLKKLTMAQYIRDARFETIGVSLKVGAAPAAWYSGDHTYIQSVLDKIPWGRCVAIAHNAMFDGAILEWVFGARPAKYLCTMMAARPYVAPAIGSASLDNVLRYLKLGIKGTAVHNFVGMRRADFTPAQLAEYGAYSCNDAEGSRKIYDYVQPLLPQDEQDLIDLTVTKFTRPQLVIETDVIKDRLAAITMERQAVLAELAVPKTSLTSRASFAKLLEGCGVRVPMKVSAATEEETFAFSKNDLPFLELRGHQDERVRKLVDARLMFSSSQEEARLRRFLEQAALTPEQWMAAPLLYYAAHTGRLGGYDSLNLQNMPRPDPKKPGVETLRMSLVAPPGYRVLAADLSNIEARLAATLANQVDLVARFARGEDVYAWFAGRMYHRPIDKTRDKAERFLGKETVLGCGYGMGPHKFQWRLQTKGVAVSAQEARRAVYFYREAFSQIPKLWTALGILLARCIDPAYMYVFGPLTFVHERIVLPNGMAIWYPGLTRTPDGLEYRHPRYGMTPIWGGHILENICQALAKIIISTAELRLARAGLKAALQVHDELVFVVLEALVERCSRAVELAMTAPVGWLPKLPVACEVKNGRAYGQCK